MLVPCLPHVHMLAPCLPHAHMQPMHPCVPHAPMRTCAMQEAVRIPRGLPGGVDAAAAARKGSALALLLAPESEFVRDILLDGGLLDERFGC